MTKYVEAPRSLLENLVHCGDTNTSITPFVTARLRELLSHQKDIDERAEFEKWLRDRPHVVNLGFNKSTGRYVLQEDEDSWQAWQARAALVQGESKC